jgi:hypothetical protein
VQPGSLFPPQFWEHWMGKAHSWVPPNLPQQMGTALAKISPLPCGSPFQYWATAGV